MLTASEIAAYLPLVKSSWSSATAEMGSKLVVALRACCGDSDEVGAGEGGG